MRDLLLFLAGSLAFLGSVGAAYRRARRELGFGGQISRITFTLALFGYTALAIAVVLASWINAWPLPISPFLSRIAAASLLLIGTIIHFVARLQFRSFRMTWGLESGELITSGIYRFIRHPQTLGWALILTGIAVLGKSGVSLTLSGLYVVTCVIWLPVEEAALRARFGPTYDRYRARTPAFLPFLRSG